MKKPKIKFPTIRIRCPDCGGPVVVGEGFLRCAICGFTRRTNAK